MKKALILAGLISLISLGVGRAQSFEDALRGIDEVIYELEELARESDPRLADKAEDAISKLEDAAKELSESPQDTQAAAGNVEGAIGELEAAVKDGDLDASAGISLMDDLVTISRGLATRALNAARSYRGKRDELRQARNHLARGDALRASGRRGSIAAFKRAANRYKDALGKAESAID